MKIKKIKIKKYKSVNNLVEINNFSDFNILVGPNNAGKTNILDAFEVFFNQDKDNLRRKNAEIELTVEINNKEQTFTYSRGKINSIPKKEARKLIRINGVSLERVATKKIAEFKKNHPKEYSDFSNILENYFQNVHINEDLFKANVNSIEKESLKRMGEGFKRLFVILFYLYHPFYKIILIDEPELHLHPSVIKKFLKILTRENLGNQVLMTTHHPTLVQARFLDKTWRVARDENHSTSVYKFDESSSIDFDRFVQEINDDNSAMLFADKVLLVEGVSDSILMRGLIDKFYRGTKDIKVVYAGGVGDIELYEKVCKIFNIPYTIMIDGDMLDLCWYKKFGKEKHAPKNKKRELLKEENIYVLEGDLESNYPKKYQKKDTKPLNALVASNKITEEDYSKMKELKKVIDAL
ncbi:MAG: ATP-dependent nuclease [Patescibacteria group bacterium]